MSDTARAKVEEIAGLDCREYDKFLNRVPCGACRSCLAREVLKLQETLTRVREASTEQTAGLRALVEKVHRAKEVMLSMSSSDGWTAGGRALEDLGHEAAALLADPENQTHRS